MGSGLLAEAEAAPTAAAAAAKQRTPTAHADQAAAIDSAPAVDAGLLRTPAPDHDLETEAWN